MIRAFFANLWGAYRDVPRVAAALPWLIVAMAGIELAQHAVELHLDFFSADMAVRKAAAMQPLRMAFGWPKMLTLWAVGFFAVRYFATGDTRAALRPPARALRLFAWVILFQFVPFAAILYAEPIVAALGLPAGQVMTFRGVFGLAQQVLEPALMLWFVGAALGDERHGPIASARTTGWLYLWALPLMFAVRIPPSILHQFLNRWPAGQGPALQWALLALDALVVGLLAVVVPAVQARIARFVMARRNLPAA